MAKKKKYDINFQKDGDFIRTSRNKIELKIGDQMLEIGRSSVASEKPETTVHILVAGRPLCGKKGTPSYWPEDHRWVSKMDAKDATCARCKNRS